MFTSSLVSRKGHKTNQESKDDLQADSQEFVGDDFQHLVRGQEIPFRFYMGGGLKRICRDIGLLGQEKGRTEGDKKEHHGKENHQHDHFL